MKYFRQQSYTVGFAFFFLKSDPAYSLETGFGVVRLEVKETDQKITAVIQIGNDEAVTGEDETELVLRFFRDGIVDFTDR